MISALNRTCCGEGSCLGLSEQTQKNLILAGKIALFAVIVLGFVAAAVFSGGAAVAAPTIGLAAIYGVICGIASLGGLVAIIASECNDLFKAGRDEDGTTDSDRVWNFLGWTIGAPLVCLCTFGPSLLQTATVITATGQGRR